MHKKENMGLVELATVSFGQSFQITPVQLITTAASIVNGGNRVTPHFWRGDRQRRRYVGPQAGLSFRGKNPVGGDQRHHAVRAGAGGIGGKRQKGKVRGSTASAARQPRRRSFREALKIIFHRLSALLRLTIRRLWPSLPLMSRRGFITAEP